MKESITINYAKDNFQMKIRKFSEEFSGEFSVLILALVDSKFQEKV